VEGDAEENAWSWGPSGRRVVGTGNLGSSDLKSCALDRPLHVGHQTRTQGGGLGKDFLISRLVNVIVFPRPAFAAKQRTFARGRNPVDMLKRMLRVYPRDQASSCRAAARMQSRIPCPCLIDRQMWRKWVPNSLAGTGAAVPRERRQGCLAGKREHAALRIRCAKGGEAKRAVVAAAPC
jgi:hypothetical protein